MITLLAHAGDTHETVAETTAHGLAWYVQLPLFIFGVLIFASIVWIITKKQDVTLLITSAGLLLSGFAFFQLAPAVSALSITAGLLTTLFITIVGLEKR